jgi:hypothetical protein
MVNYGTVYGTVPSWPCQCKNSLTMASPPQTSHFRSSVSSSHDTLLLWTTLRLGWGCISSGEGPSSGLHGTQNRTQYLNPATICVLFMNNCCIKKMNVMGRNWSQTAKLRSESFCKVAPSLYDLDRTFQSYRTSTVLYGTNTVRTI